MTFDDPRGAAPRTGPTRQQPSGPTRQQPSGSTPQQQAGGAGEAGRPAASGRGSTALGWFAALALFTLFAGQFWRDLIGWGGYLTLAGLITIGSVIAIVRMRPRPIPARPGAPTRDTAHTHPAASPNTRPSAHTNTSPSAHAGPATSPSAHPNPNTSPATSPSPTPRDHPSRPARRLPFRKVPKTLALFLLMATVSIAWSFYPGASALGVAAQWCTTAGAVFLALCLTWGQLLRALGTSLRWVIGLSLLFELIVAAFVRHPVLPLWVHYDQPKIPQAFYWSRGLLFHGGQIQGIQGNSNLLAMSALLALIVFGVQLADRTVKRGWGITWLIAAAASFLLSRSSTVIIALVVVALVLLLALWTRRRDPRKRGVIYGTAFGVIVLGTASAIALWGPILKLLGKSEDLTGRLTIWKAVTDLAVQRPVFGWGWVSYWAPWAEPFKSLAVRKGVTYLQAHNAYLDVWLQLGIVGLILFILLVTSTLGRSWFAAVDRPRVAVADTLPYTAVTLLPLLLMAALIAQSAAESRMLSEGGWALLALLAIKTKSDRP